MFEILKRSLYKSGTTNKQTVFTVLMSSSRERTELQLCFCFDLDSVALPKESTLVLINDSNDYYFNVFFFIKLPKTAIKNNGDFANTIIVRD